MPQQTLEPYQPPNDQYMYYDSYGQTIDYGGMEVSVPSSSCEKTTPKAKKKSAANVSNADSNGEPEQVLYPSRWKQRSPKDKCLILVKQLSKMVNVITSNQDFSKLSASLVNTIMQAKALIPPDKVPEIYKEEPRMLLHPRRNRPPKSKVRTKPPTKRVPTLKPDTDNDVVPLTKIRKVTGKHWKDVYEKNSETEEVTQPAAVSVTPRPRPLIKSIVNLPPLTKTSAKKLLLPRLNKGQPQKQTVHVVLQQGNIVSRSAGSAEPVTIKSDDVSKLTALLKLINPPAVKASSTPEPAIQPTAAEPAIQPAAVELAVTETAAQSDSVVTVTSNSTVKTEPKPIVVYMLPKSVAKRKLAPLEPKVTSTPPSSSS